MIKRFGLSNLDKIKREKNRIKNFRLDVENLAVIYEGDSHCINEIGKKNCWIKLNLLFRQFFCRYFE